MRYANKPNVYGKHPVTQKKTNYTKTKQQTAKNTKLMNTNSGTVNMNCKNGTKKAACKNKGVGHFRSMASKMADFELAVAD